MTKTRIGVVRGGQSSEYDISLQTGAVVIGALDREKYEPLDVIISKDGLWHIYGMETKPHEALRRVDVIFNCLHGYYGEDGKIQQFLESHSMPFTGSGSLSSAIAMNKVMAKEYFRRAGLKTPMHVLVERENVKGNDGMAGSLAIVHSKFALPYIVKPVSAGSSIGVSLVKNHTEFAPALAKAFEFGDSVMVEEYIPGVEADVGVIERFRGMKIYALPPVEIRIGKGAIFDYEAKYGSKTEGRSEIVPATFPASIKKELERLAVAAHEALGLRHYSRSDLIVSPRRGIFVMESNALPGLTKESLVPKALEAVGASLSEFVDHLITLALDE